MVPAPPGNSLFISAPQLPRLYKRQGLAKGCKLEAWKPNEFLGLCLVWLIWLLQIFFYN